MPLARMHLVARFPEASPSAHHSLHAGPQQKLEASGIVTVCRPEPFANYDMRQDNPTCESVQFCFTFHCARMRSAKTTTSARELFTGGKFVLPSSFQVCLHFPDKTRPKLLFFGAISCFSRVLAAFFTATGGVPSRAADR